VDVAKFSPDDSVPRDGRVLFVGRLLPHKGVDLLIDAVPADLPLDVIGQPLLPPYFEDLQKRAAGKRVSFHHDISDEALVRSYRSALCLVLPSVHRNLYGGETAVPELLGQTLLEAMACGTAVVAADVASLPEVVDESCGFIVPPNDPVALRARLVWIRDHPSEAKAMGARGRLRVLEHFTWPAVVERCLAHYGDERRATGAATGG
jgi:glycosyltransferase involved in cell wall biosynthesis